MVRTLNVAPCVRSNNVKNMEHLGPPPLPPKTRRSPPESTTVLATEDVFGFVAAAPEVNSGSHVVKIRINPDSDLCDLSPCIRISVNNGEMPESNGFCFYTPFMSSGQISPSDTLDSGTCSDLDGTPPPLPKKKSSGVSVTVIGAQHKRASSLTDSDDDGSNLSCDSLNSDELQENQESSKFLPQGLLKDIRDHAKFQEEEEIREKSNLSYETDKYYDFHINEHFSDSKPEVAKGEDETFAGYKDLLNGDCSSTIRSAKGTIRGVKNRVRAGIATFLQYNDQSKTYKEKDANKVVVYTTTMGIVRETHHACMKVKQILRTLLVKFEERDVFMSTEYQAEIRDRMRCEHILVPQVFVDGQHIGDAETVERLNESGELRRILKPYKSMDACNTCQSCGGYRLLPCPVCNGSKKSVHRNHFTAEFVALKCMNCDEVGLVKCSSCSL